AASLDVARYFIHLASPEEREDVDCLCHLRLQKLLYYAQGWHLAAYGKPLFAGRIEAWTNGPVVRDVYPHFADFKYRSIPPTQGSQSVALSPKETEFVQSIWEGYKQYSATALRDKTHREPPWQGARRGLAPHEKASVEITHESLRAYFGS